MKEKYLALDGIRGVAALFVCVLHVSVWGVGPAWAINIERSLIAVDLFFVLSGFVIACSYEQRLADGRMTARDFVLTRIIRLYPMYLVALLFAVVAHRDDLLQSEQSGHVYAALASVVWLPWKVDGNNIFFPLNIAYWSLFYELLVNFLYVATRRWLTNSVLLSVVLVSAGLLVLLVHGHGMDLGPYWGGIGPVGGLVRAIFGISVGVFLFRWRLSAPAWLTGKGGYLLPLAIIVLLLGVPPIPQIENRLMLAAVLFIFPWCVLYAAHGARSAGRTAGVLRFFGAISYPVYVLHLPLWVLLCQAIPDKLSQMNPVQGVVLVLASVIGCAVILEKYVEQPLRHWMTARIFGPPSGVGFAGTTTQSRSLKSSGVS
ncbi:MAG: acyltransferase [Steroidobacteraceae bacterium]